jgi:hypothetical protein
MFGATNRRTADRLLPNGVVRDLQAMKDARARGRALMRAESFELVNAVAEGEQVASVRGDVNV